MDSILNLKPISVQCDHDDLEACDKCMHMRCEYCNQVGERKAQTFDLEMLDMGPRSIIYWECADKRCQDRRSYDFDMGKAMAKGEL